jgi:L-iditol 2-dehydrogenase
MKAAIVEHFGSLVVREIEEPKPGDYDALCELLYGATCTGTDSHIIEGNFPWISKLPTILGHESVGRVISVGRKVRNYKVGDLVTRVCAVPTSDGKISVTWGGFAEYGIAKDHWAMCADGLPESEWAGARVNQIIPAAIDPKTAPMFTTWRETLSFIKRLGVFPGAKVLVAGSGGNGLAFAAHSAWIGAEVAMIGSAKREKCAAAVGVTHYFDYKNPELTTAIGKQVPEGFDFAVDVLATPGVSDQLLRFLKPKGRISVYGIFDFGKNMINLGCARGEFVFCPPSYSESETHQEISEAVLQGRLDANLWYDAARPYPLSEIAAAFEDVKTSLAPKILIKLKA